MDFSVSVIIPTKNRISSLNLAIKSVLLQAKKPNEIIILDDNINKKYNNSVENIRKKYCSKLNIKVIKTKGVGASKARNIGVINSESELIAFLDDDDFWLPNKLEIQCEHMRSCKKGCAAIFSQQMNIYKDFNHKKVISGKLPLNVEELLFDNPMPGTSTILIWKIIFLSLGGFDEKLKARQDRDFWIRLLTYYKVCIINEPLVKVSVSLGKRKSISLSEDKIDGIIQFSKKWEKHPTLKKKKLIKKFWSKHYLSIAAAYRSIGEDYKSKKAIIKSLKFKFSIINFIKFICWKLNLPKKIMRKIIIILKNRFFYR
jgi:glycosyltransferase involved in cell wall biosynthesis